MTGLPRATSRMLGRAAELARLSDSLAHVPVAVIYGIGGLGKSTLARAFAERWDGTAVWVAAGARPAIAAITAEVFRQLGVARYDLDAGDAERVAALAEVLDRHRALLVIDDLHALTPDARQLLLAEAARQLRHARLIATSRELVAMTVGDVDRLHLRLEPLDRAATEDLCAELAAMFGTGHAPERVWEASHGNPFLIRQAHVGAADAYNPLDDAVASLAGPPRQLAVALAIAHAPLPHAVLAAVAPNADAGLQVLVTRLIADRSAEQTYAMHALVREAVLRAVPDPERAEVRDRLIAALQAALPGDALIATTAELAHHLRAAARFAELAALLDTWGGKLSRTGADGFVLQELQELPAAVMTERLRVLRARTLCHWLQIRRAYELLSADRVGSVPGQLVLGNIAIWAGAWPHAEAVFGPLAADASLPVDTRLRAAFGLAWLAVNRGTWNAEAADRLRGLGVPAFYLEALRLGDALLRGAELERLDDAQAIVEEFLPRLREPWVRLMLPLLLSLLLSRAGELDQAAQVITWSESMLTLQRDRLEIRNARVVVAVERGERVTHLGALRDFVRLFDRGGFFTGRAWSRTVLARVLYQLGRRREAAMVVDELRALGAAVGTTVYLPAIAAIEREDPLHPAWLAPRRPPPHAKRGEAIRHQVQDVLRLAAAGSWQAVELPPLEVPDGPYFALDRACLALAGAVHARRRGQTRLAAQELRRAMTEAGAGEVDAELVPALSEALDRSAAPPPAAPDELVIDRAHHELSSAGRRVSLAARPVLRQLLYAFADRPDRRMSDDDIAELLWQTAYDPERHASTLKSNVRRLRDVMRELGAEILREDHAYRLAPRAGLRVVS